MKLTKEQILKIYASFDVKIIWNESKAIDGIHYNDEIDFVNDLYPISTLIHSLRCDDEQLGHGKDYLRLPDVLELLDKWERESIDVRTVEAYRAGRKSSLDDLKFIFDALLDLHVLLAKSDLDTETYQKVSTMILKLKKGLESKLKGE